MKKVNVEKFLADYELAVKEKEEAVAKKDVAIAEEKAKVDALVGFSDHVKEILFAEIVAEKDKEFDFSGLDAKIEGFEKYLEDVVEETPVVEEQPVENTDPNTLELEVRLDEFGNPIV